ncbi:MAG TPA: GTP-binding protein, partial [Acidisarcina sp.]
LLRSGKPLVLAVNKIDTEAMAAAAENYRTLGFKTIVPVSAEHSIGIDDLLDEVFAHLKFPEIAANSDKSQLNDGQIPKAAALLDENDLDDLADLADDLDEDDLDELRNEDTGPQHVAPEEEDPEAEDPEAEKKESRQTLNPGTPSTRSMNPGTPSTRSMSPGTPSTRSMSPGSPSTDSMNPGAPFMRSMSGKATPPTAPPKAETNPGAPEQTNPEQTNPEEEPHPKGLHRTHGEFELHETKVAIIGRPNVGKSTLLNALTGTTRAIVSPIAGTTRDAVDELITYEGARLRIIDTAGIRRKGKTTQMAEKLSVVMARRHLEAADVALLMIDAVEGVTAADATIGGYAHESGRSVIIVINKWDLVTTSRTDGKPPADRRVYEEQLRGALKYLSYAPIVFISASEGRNLGRVLQLIKTVAAARRKRVTTGQMNRFLERVDFQRASVPMAKKLRIYYMTQAAVAPPTFVLFANRAIKLHFSFERFLENQIREHFGFEGTPIWFKVKARNEKTKD